MKIPESVHARMIERVRGMAVDLSPGTDCWLWPGWLRSDGYGTVGARDGGKRYKVGAHRVSYEAFVGPIPDGLTVDHMCHVRNCWNPRHLRLATRSQNSRLNRFALQNHCPQGHPYDAENTYVVPKSGWRQCRICNHGRSVARGIREREARHAARQEREVA